MKTQRAHPAISPLQRDGRVIVRSSLLSLHRFPSRPHRARHLLLREYLGAFDSQYTIPARACAPHLCTVRAHEFSYTSSSLRRASPTATANSGPIPSSTERIKAGAEVFANGSATRTSMEKILFAYVPSSLVTPPPPVSMIEVTDFLCSVSYCMSTRRASEKIREKTSSGLPSVSAPPRPSSFFNISARAMERLPETAMARVMSWLPMLME